MVLVIFFKMLITGHEAVKLLKILVHFCLLPNTCLFDYYLFAFSSVFGIMSVLCVCNFCRHWAALQFWL